jgi:hypothetical protein
MIVLSLSDWFSWRDTWFLIKSFVAIWILNRMIGFYWKEQPFEIAFELWTLFQIVYDLLSLLKNHLFLKFEGISLYICSLVTSQLGAQVIK